ncbi:RHS repeat-associated core domain-containing protein, partial [Pseudoalteromonas sp. S3178]|uniref:RHS repeat-associated core domain-containing protein n=1 Tax=Pseudoalteromonas sp. S3178 TaxID=579532 RepID=UPI0024B6025D
RRIAKHTEHGKIDYIWDNDQLIGECQHGEYTWYINLPNQFHPVALIKKGEVYYYHLDQLNTPRFVTNNKAEVVWENQADVYGYEEPEAEPNTNKEHGFTQPIRFQGQYLDEESGLHYNRYRYYSPKQQRFINQDPIGLVGGINHYQYAPNPVNWVDPFGLSCKDGGPKRVVFAGHGIIDETKSAIVPVGSTLTVYAFNGATITDDLGQLIESGGSLNSDVYKKVYVAGDVIPGYVLLDNPGDIELLDSSVQVSKPTDISELLAENVGDCHWAACASIFGHENENVIHHTEGIFKKESNKFYQLQEDGTWEDLPDDNSSDSNRGPVDKGSRGEISPDKKQTKKWNKKIVEDRVVYQRGDLFNPIYKDKFGKTNIERMKKGKAPIGYDGEEVNLHHLTQDEPGSMAELGSVFHSENDRFLHIYTNQYDKSYKGSDNERHRYSSAPPPMDRGPFNRWKKKYWKNRANDYE